MASRTSSRTRLEVLGLEGQVLGFGLEASSPQKLPCPQLEDSTIFCTVEVLLENARNLANNLRRPFLFSAGGDRLKNFIIIIINRQRCKRICYRWVKSFYSMRRLHLGPLQQQLLCYCHFVWLLVELRKPSSFL